MRRFLLRQVAQSKTVLLRPSGASNGSFERTPLQVCKDSMCVIVYTIPMSTHNRDLDSKQQRLESIEARLDQHLKTVKLALTVLSVLGVATLMLLLYHTIPL
jgi:hypothetical protein